MQKFFVPKENILPTKVLLTGDDIYHIIKVLRKNIGDLLEISDGEGTDYTVRIAEISKECITTDIVSEFKSQVEKLNVVLYQSLPKSDKMDLIVQKCTELGISEIRPFISEHTVVEVDNSKIGKKIERWSKIAQEACKQCGRSNIPKIERIYSFKELLSTISGHDLTILAYEKEQNGGIKKVLRENTNAKSISLIVGPEGGFAESEVAQLIDKGAKVVTLGPRILRTETAGMAILCMIMYELGDMGEWIQ